MINLEVVRYSFGVEATLGLLFDITGGQKKFLAYTLEDEAREVKVPGETCIPPGTYEVTLRTEGGFHQRYSDADWVKDIHKGMLWVRNVPEFEYILIHTGNKDEHTDGCILIGDSASQNITEEGSIGSSRAAYRRVYPPIAAALLNGERVAITVREVL